MTTQEKRKLIMLLLLPPVIVLFSALAFFAFGGGKGTGQTREANVSKGINTQLPGAQLKKGQEQDKMSLYNQAQRDSATAKSSSAQQAFASLGWDTAGQSKSTAIYSQAQTNEAKIKQKLSEINLQISQPEPSPSYAKSYPQSYTPSPDVDRLEKLLKQKSQGNAEDPEMKQLNTMLDKIMQIQNPGLAKEKQKTDKPAVKDSAFKAIPATIDGNQKVAPGGVVKLILKDTITINGVTYPKGQSLSGLCAVTNQRLLLDIKNIRVGTAIVPVNLTVFSLDGMPGIAAPEAELGQAAGDGANGALENMQFLSADYSLSTQAATAGISAAKGLLSKKVKKIRVKLKGGETVLLRNNQLNH